MLGGERLIVSADVADEEPYRAGDPVRRALVDLAGARSAIQVALRKDDALLGSLTVYRQEVRPFSEDQIAVLRNFAAQAVIAMENARLLTETREALERQTATAEVLQVINSSPGNLTPVFEAMLAKATRLCEAGFGTLWICDGEHFSVAATHAIPAALAEFLHEPVPVAASASLVGIAGGQNLVHVPDMGASKEYHAGNRARRAFVDLGGARTLLSVALRRDNALLGAFSVYRQEMRPFSDEEIALVQNFAAQAVIAIENARLLKETREALARQTATAEVLQVINSSPGDLAPVFDAILEKAHSLCGVAHGSLQLFDGRKFRAVAVRGISEAFANRLREGVSLNPNPQSASLLKGARFVQIPDLGEVDDPVSRAAFELAGQRTVLFLPLRKDGTLLGRISASRREVKPFTEKEIGLLESFAAQAVIAMENARLLGELRDRQAELRVTFDNMGDGVVMFGSDTRLVAWNRNLQEMLDLPDAVLSKRPSLAELFRYLAARGEFGSADLEAQLSRSLEDTKQEMRYERTRPDGRVVEVRRNAVPGGGFVLIYADITERKHAEQAVRAARDAAETALRDLQAAQASLVHAQKMAALGQLTAGIAHEIKNPLNFVNNFAELSVELLEELKGTTAEAIGSLDSGKRTGILETIQTLTGNLAKIAEHGHRADGIVRGMLQHARRSTGSWQAVDLNAVVEESMNLAYHGARAQDQDFKVALELDLDRDLAPIEVVSEDVSRVLLNLISNGFYAVTERGREGEGAFRPLLKIVTREFGEGVEIRVRDNGVGVPTEYREKLFQPFFTTKPTGKGTGLGLSISYEIITQQHGGTITVDSEVGDFTEFTLRLPRRQHGVA